MQPSGQPPRILCYFGGAAGSADILGQATSPTRNGDSVVAAFYQGISYLEVTALPWSEALTAHFEWRSRRRHISAAMEPGLGGREERHADASCTAPTRAGRRMRLNCCRCSGSDMPSDPPQLRPLTVCTHGSEVAPGGATGRALAR